jgi:hypothetical protein
MQGHVITWNLARNPAVSEVILGDYDEGRARLVACRVGGGKTKAVFLDAADTKAVAAAAAGAGLVINAVIPEFNLSIMRACLKLRRRLPGHGLRPDQDQDHRRGVPRADDLASDFEKAGLLALLSTGMDPGFTNTLAANGYEDLDRCFEIRIKGLCDLRLPGAAAGLVAGDLLHRLRPAPAALRRRGVQAGGDLRAPREVRLPGAVRPRHGDLPRSRRSQHPAAYPARRRWATRACAMWTSRWVVRRRASTPTWPWSPRA